ncbi:MAG TPA: plastocyanin/azurin family copper-binding protein [Gaiellaceae bacterium]|nr:plastocyanin/azurin family copper-binding protein [Gaiellaceae bacterium]
MTRRTTIALLLVGVALAFGAIACGGDDNSTAGGETTTEATTTEAMTTTEETTTTTTSGSASNVLKGETGPGFTIEVSQNGEDAETVKAGTYTLEVEDKSDMHNFHLIGPGVDEVVTEVPFVGDKSVTVTLQKGTYTYQCDPHAASGMKGTFTVS